MYCKSKCSTFSNQILTAPNEDSRAHGDGLASLLKVILYGLRTDPLNGLLDVGSVSAQFDKLRIQ